MASGLINYNFSDLLPSNMEGVARWEQFLSAFQQVFEDFMVEEVNPIYDQTNIEKMTKTDFLNFANELGHTISNFAGWSDSTDYFKRELVSLKIGRASCRERV